VAENVKTAGSLDVGELKHVLRDRRRQVIGVGLVAVGISPQVRRDESVAVRAGLEEWQELAMVLRPPVKTKNCGATAYGHVVKVHSIHARPLVLELHHGRLG
jgi:hypothetical protein